MRNKQTLKTEGSDWVKDEDLAAAGGRAGAAAAMMVACADEARAISVIFPRNRQSKVVIILK
jgi:hypothetical protein